MYEQLLEKYIFRLKPKEQIKYLKDILKELVSEKQGTEGVFKTTISGKIKAVKECLDCITNISKSQK